LLAALAVEQQRIMLVAEAVVHQQLERTQTHQLAAQVHLLFLRGVLQQVLVKMSVVLIGTLVVAVADASTKLLLVAMAAAVVQAVKVELLLRQTLVVVVVVVHFMDLTHPILVVTADQALLLHVI
jgi:hypothetical protein